MTVRKTEDHCLRIDPENPDHHLYRNNGTWWIHYTRLNGCFKSSRIRRSLRTRCIRTARRRRDEHFRRLGLLPAR